MPTFVLGRRSVHVKISGGVLFVQRAPRRGNILPVGTKSNGIARQSLEQPAVRIGGVAVT